MAKFAAQLRGADELRRAARDLRRIERQEMTKEIRGAVKHAVDRHLPDLLRASAAAHAPSGYRDVIAPAMRTTTRAKPDSNTPTVTVTIWGKGKGSGAKSHRDVRRLNDGQLRHPVWGRYRMALQRLAKGVEGPLQLKAQRNPWRATTIRPGMVDRPVQAVREPMVAEVDEALSKIADRFNRGGARL